MGIYKQALEASRSAVQDHYDNLFDQIDSLMSSRAFVSWLDANGLKYDENKGFIVDAKNGIPYPPDWVLDSYANGSSGTPGVGGTR